MPRPTPWFLLASLTAVACFGEAPVVGETSSASTRGAASSTTRTSAITGSDAQSSSATSPTESSTGSTPTSGGTDTDATDFGPCSQPVTPLIVTRENGNYTIRNDEFQLELDPETNLNVASLQLLGVELLHRGLEPAERFMGIGLFVQEDATEYSWRNQTATASVLEVGPAVVRIEVQWAVDDNGTPAALQGTTIYTVIPDGRLVREESVNLSEAPITNAWLTAYVALNAARFDSVQATFELCDNTDECSVGGVGQGGGIMLLGTAPREGDHWICAADNASGHSVSWVTRGDSAVGPVTASPRVTEVYFDAPDSHSLALQYDWSRMEVAPDGTYGLHAMVFADVSPREPCACAEQHFNAYTSPAALQAPDVAFLNYRSSGGYYDVGVTKNAVELSFAPGNLPPTLLIRLQDATAVTGVTLAEEILSEGIDYQTQSGRDPQVAWLYVARPLEVEQVLSIAVDL